MLEHSLGELEATFRYMGSSHPNYEETRERISELRDLLRELAAHEP